ncbi:signal transduction protein [Oscillochloris trichoides DG-6]|uniref:Signal transduction protein n=1 Tax=Oscillochloris trichoides DG-6 TaxID=765420 RepID=E1IEM5_9CHLR|nr:SUMF1/EgtB/PvdO family nonheme iron enzyme [Oscillochloris trichoides]EFO80366.1 signal transduction protein [Oscillochloris trichoides DG-6]
MNQPDPQIDQSQQQGGVNLGAFNEYKHVEIGDVIAGDKITIQKVEIIVYTGDAHPTTPEMRAALLRAYRSEVAVRYMVWRQRYATLPMVAQTVAAPRSTGPLYEREELTFVALRRSYAAEPTEHVAYTFTDLREALARDDHLMLLGPPGGGKTTALWRLALDLAEAGSGGDDSARVPVFVRLGGIQPGHSLRDLISAELQSAALEDAHRRRFPLTAHRNLVNLLDTLLAEGRLVLFWDGLNEVPRSEFVLRAQALETFRRTHPGRLGSLTQSITTCRADDHAQLVAEAGGTDPYPVQPVVIQGLDQATIRQVVLGRLGDTKGSALLDALHQPAHRTLADLARTPLLLTMLCTVYDTAGTLPRNRGQLLQAFVRERWAWEAARRPQGWIPPEVQEPALAHLAYTMTKSEGRGTSVARHFAERQIRPLVSSHDSAELLRQARDADLIELLGAGAQVRFSHQLVQEYFAAVALQRELLATTKLNQGSWLHKRILARYIKPGERTGWEETLLLLAGIEEEGSIAQTLIRSFASRPLQAARLLEAEGANSDPLLRDEVCKEALRQITDRAIAWQRRFDAGRALSLLGDPRFPVTLEAWQASIAQRGDTFTPTGEYYWRYLPAGRYHIGGWKEKRSVVEHDLAAFWVARLPITVAQFARFVAEGYREDRHWTAHGLKWRRDRTSPYLWNDPRFNGANQAVIGVTWYEATAFCRWLTAHLSLPAGYVLRLPTEAEWEVAAAYDGSATPRTYPWGKEPPTPERAVYKDWKLDAPAPVGLCPAGMAACGALDLAGNVWEWCSSHYNRYPEAAYTLEKDFTPRGDSVPLRGGAYYRDGTNVRCGARDGDHPDLWNFLSGFRVVVSPPLAHTS